jgi:type I restriction enzyme S subunit
MAGEWQKRILGDLIENFDSLRVPVKETERVAGPYPYYGASGIVDYVDGYIVDGEYLLIAEDGENLRTRNTPIAFIAHGKFWVNNHAHIVQANREAETRFLMYALAMTDISGYLTGSTMPKLTQSNLNRIPITAPPLPEQRAIAQILGALDDKIKLNRRMNATLEAMARALFQSWFVDFDPVRAKLRGEQPAGLAPEIAALFPDALVETELGAAPVGWEMKYLGDVMELAYGKALKAENRRDGSIPVFGSNGQIGWHDEILVSGPGVVVGRKGNPGVVTWVPTDFFAIDTTFFVKQRSEIDSVYFLYFALQAQGLASLSADSAVPGLNRNMVYMNKQVMPPQQLIQQFEIQARHLFSRVYRGMEEARTLATLRDALLPRLISGQLRVADAERIAGRSI